MGVELTGALKGIYIQLEDGRELIDGVGGAAVSCIGNGHPKVVKAVQDQAEKLACIASMLFHIMALNLST